MRTVGHDRMVITDLERCDFPVIRGWIDPSLFRIFRAPIGDDQLEGLLSKRSDGRLTDLGLKAVDDTGSAIGFIHVILDWANDLGHIQQILVGEPGLRRQGAGSAMMQHALGVCFDEHRLHRIQLFVDEGNEPALAFYRKQGFHTDGFMRESRKIGDRFVGWYGLSMLQSEWNKRKGGGQRQAGSDAQKRGLGRSVGPMKNGHDQRHD